MAVDAKHSLIVEQHVTNVCNYRGLLALTAGAAMEAPGVERIDAVADMGYHKGEDIEACEAAGITPYIPRPHRGINVSNDLFPKERFRYDPVADAYHCPGGQMLDTRHSSITRGHVTVQYSSPAACAGCEMKTLCTTGRWRRVNRWEKEHIIERMAERLKKRPDILVIRRSTVEHPFGTIKQSMNQGAFLMRGLEKVRAEFSLIALAYNLRRAITFIGVPGMMQAAISPATTAGMTVTDLIWPSPGRTSRRRYPISTISLRTYPANHLASRFRTVWMVNQDRERILKIAFLER